MPKRGRPRGSDALTPEIHAQIVRWMEAGNYLETAAPLSGVATSTARRWMARGRKQKRGKFRDFLDAVKKAGAAAESRNVLLIQSAARKQWQAAAWYLERMHPDRWARMERREISGPGGDAIRIQTLKDGAAAVAAALGIGDDADGGSEAENEAQADDTKPSAKHRGPRGA